MKARTLRSTKKPRTLITPFHCDKVFFASSCELIFLVGWRSGIKKIWQSKCWRFICSFGMGCVLSFVELDKLPECQWCHFWQWSVGFLQRFFLKKTHTPPFERVIFFFAWEFWGLKLWKRPVVFLISFLGVLFGSTPLLNIAEDHPNQKIDSTRRRRFVELPRRYLVLKSRDWFIGWSYTRNAASGIYQELNFVGIFMFFRLLVVQVGKILDICHPVIWVFPKIGVPPNHPF